MNPQKKSSDKKLARFRELPSQGGGLDPAFKHATWSEILEESYRVPGSARPAGVSSNSALRDAVAGAADQP
jgi:hypothetical protein